MNATRRTVLGWLIAAVIAPPRFEPMIDLAGNPVEVLFNYILNTPYEFELEWNGAWQNAADYCAESIEQELMTSIEIGVTDG